MIIASQAPEEFDLDDAAEHALLRVEETSREWAAAAAHPTMRRYWAKPRPTPWVLLRCEGHDSGTRMRLRSGSSPVVELVYPLGLPSARLSDPADFSQPRLLVCEVCQTLRHARPARLIRLAVESYAAERRDGRDYHAAMS